MRYKKKNKTGWEENFQKLKEYRSDHEYEPSKKDDPALYQWLQSTKNSKKSDEVTISRKQKIQSLKFKGSLLDKIWDENFDLLIKYLKENDNHYPSQRNQEPVAHKIAVWLLRIRSDFRKGELSEYRLSKLHSINFPFDPYEVRWQNFYNGVVKWIQTHKTLPTSTTNSKLYFWLNVQLEKNSNKTLDPSKRSLIEKLEIKKLSPNPRRKKQK